MIKTDLSKFANKKYGQNFLKDERYVYKIIQSMPKDDLRVVEIGPGLGDLTAQLLKEKHVIAFEVDKRLCEHLSHEFKDFIEKKSFELRCGDVLTHWECGSLLDEPYHLVANLPYYIATRIILRAMRDDNCQSILVMVQKEVADKFSANSGDKEFSALSVLANCVGNAKVCFEVPPEAFVPPPKIVSAVLMINKDMSLDDSAFDDFLKVAFAQPRKKLISNLSSSYPKEALETKFAMEMMDTNIRPHEATTQNYKDLYKYTKEFSNGK